MGTIDLNKEEKISIQNNLNANNLLESSNLMGNGKR